ncbi:MAG: hypothetical protein KME56_00335 [Candidatus Thiodiazotropha sp. (ex Ctena orbiculata)]|uniref:Uncharacterized protein n=1 Tax=Candidatus Thiodiazotropha taylori TaxID=2792791 RepID=A0A944M5S7_9GAMM|nr:hypothetical protein [Candidatus Thiodiazotropha taylori]PUB82667.1 MAG: hypothetical protein DBP01_15980 [gamma proteobacterium symbiont of Ctena orbiculata]MBT2987689.1 hypothetical protein [Candidatus Thiodiazotropha taylori]MBT2995068.1 hypothetical protein [Candidatus Thiodiazotropha taylori]MBT3000013.1 hypothetical protein [Candidatus Thiodiazotropha taylori]
MKKLSDNLKRMLNGLAQQDAGEFLSMHDKMKVLGMEPETSAKPSPPPRNMTKKPATHRIAFISDGRGVGAPLAYAIDACSRQGTKIDLLIHGTTDLEKITALENQIRAAGLDHHRIQLGMNAVDDIFDYTRNHPSLIFLVAMPDDNAAKVLIEESIPKRGARIPVPLVLIEDRPSTRQAEQSAA